ncbi:hypothetical protein BGZ95_006126, partial [Linnemannia exigua]
MPADRSRSTSPSKSILVDKATPRPRRPRREISFQEPATSSIQSSFLRPTTEEPSTGNDAAPEDEANSTLITPTSGDASADQANNTLTTSPPKEDHNPASNNDPVLNIDPITDNEGFTQVDHPDRVTSHPTQADTTLSRLEARWIYTCTELQAVVRRASNTTRPNDYIEWDRGYFTYLKEHERSLRADMLELIPRPPPPPPQPADPNLIAFHTAYQTTATAYCDA